MRHRDMIMRRERGWGGPWDASPASPLHVLVNNKRVFISFRNFRPRRCLFPLLLQKYEREKNDEMF